MSPADRLRLIMKNKGFASPYAMSRGTKISRSSLQNVLDRNKIGKKLAAQIAHALELNAVWVESGFGDMSLTADCVADSSPNIDEAVSEYPAIDRYAYIRKAKARLSAGGGVVAEEEYEDDRYAFLKEWLKTVATSAENCVLMEVDGDSMLPTFEGGDLVLVDRGWHELISDGIYAFGEGDLINIKRLERAHPLVRIVSDNPNQKSYPPRSVDPSSIRIIGRVIWYARQLR